MIEAIATVLDVESDRVLVEVQRRTACGSCESKDGCGTSALAGWFSRRVSRLPLRTTLPLRVGDAVVIGLEEAALLRASLLLYLLPILALVAGALGGAALAGSDGGEWLGVAGGVSGFAAGLALARFRAASLPWRDDAEVVVLRRHGNPVSVPMDPGSVGNATKRSV